MRVSKRENSKQHVLAIFEVVGTHRGERKNKGPEDKDGRPHQMVNNTKQHKMKKKKEFVIGSLGHGRRRKVERKKKKVSRLYSVSQQAVLRGKKRDRCYGVVTAAVDQKAHLDTLNSLAEPQ